MLPIIFFAGTIANFIDTPNYSTNFAPSSFVIMQPQEELISIKLDGTVKYGPHYTPDAAAKAFWEAVSHNAPCKMEK